MSWKFNQRYLEASPAERVEMEIDRADYEMDMSKDARSEREFANTETSRKTMLPSEGQSDESPEGPGRTQNKPLMRNASANVAIPTGITDGNNFRTGPVQ